MRELVPAAARVAVLVNPANVMTTEPTVRDAQGAARAMGTMVTVVMSAQIADIAEGQTLCPRNSRTHVTNDGLTRYGLKDTTMLKYVRIFLDPKSREDMDPICVDAALNEQQKIAGKWFIFGLSGNTDDKNTWYPIVCRIDGTIDFGAGYEDERWWTTNIREKTIQVGSLVSVWDESEQEFLFQVAKIQELSQTSG